MKTTKTVTEAIHAWGKRYFRSYVWSPTDGFTAVGKAGATFMYDAPYVVNKFKAKGYREA